MVDFFISVSGKDKTWGDWIAWQLRDAGYTFRYQHWDFQIGENFLRHMASAGMESRATLLVLSPNYFTSDFTQLELEQALYKNPTGKGPGIVPVVVEKVDLRGQLIGP
jgi:TIR domain